MTALIVEQNFHRLEQLANKEWQDRQKRTTVLVGTATCGRSAGANETLNAIKKEIARQDLAACVFEAGCLGHCYAEPVVIINKPGFPAICYGSVTEGVAVRLVNDFLLHHDPCLEFALAALEPNDLLPSFEDFPRSRCEHKIITKHWGSLCPGEINHYLALGGYRALASALQKKPAAIVAEVKEAALRGRGGAYFPTGFKWEACLKSAGYPKYVIGNADEGDPGAFMDRALLESNPHLVLEGLAIAAYAIGAAKAYIYVRAEYPLAVERIKTALEQAKEKGIFSGCIFGGEYNLEIEIFQGCGAFVCGEETALIASLEGKPGLPRPRPPFPATKGLYGKPTLVNNIKTLAYLPFIIKEGAHWFKNIGEPANPGTVVLALAGKVNNTGLVEVPTGTPLRQIIDDMGSGIPGKKKLKAVQIGGPSGSCLPESMLDMPLDPAALARAGAIMGSGGIIVLDEDDCLVETARFFLDFTQQESCGKCAFCRLGTKQMLDILERITKGQGEAKDIDLLFELAEDVKAGSLCGLGKTAPNPVLSTINHFRQEYEAHIRGRCPARMCRKLTAYYILSEKCERTCDACVGSCPVEAIYTNKEKIKVIDQEKCIKCQSCLDACPPRYGAVVKVSPPEKQVAHEKGRRK